MAKFTGTNPEQVPTNADLGTSAYIDYDEATAKTDVAQTWTANQTFADNAKALFGDGGDLELYHNGSTSYIENNSGSLFIRNLADDLDVIIQSDDGAGGLATYIIADGSLGSVSLNHYGTTKLSTKSTGIDVTGAVKPTTYQETYTTFTSTSNAATVDTSTATVFTHTLTENTTLTFSNPPTTGTAYGMTIKIVQDAGASGYTVTWPASVDWAAATAPTLTATASAVDVFTFYTHDGGTTWYGFVAGQAMA